jgi:hypothetical protein
MPFVEPCLLDIMLIDTSVADTGTLDFSVDAPDYSVHMQRYMLRALGHLMEIHSREDQLFQSGDYEGLTIEQSKVI